MPVLWFWFFDFYFAFTCFQFWSKAFTKHWTNNSLPWKQFIPFLNWLVTCFQFQNMFWKNANCFQFWLKTYTKCCTSNYVIPESKDFLPLHFAVDQECHVTKNIALKTWQWKPQFWFCSAFVYFADLKTIYFVSCLCCSW